MRKVKPPPDFDDFGPMYTGFGQAVSRWIESLPPGKYTYIDPFDGEIEVGIEVEGQVDG